MLSGVLNSPKAMVMNIAIIQAFIALRQCIFQYDELASQIIEIKKTVSNHNEQLNQINKAIENLLYEKAVKKTWEERERTGFIPWLLSIKTPFPHHFIKLYFRSPSVTYFKRNSELEPEVSDTTLLIREMLPVT